MHYPICEKASVSYGIAKNINDEEIIHLCYTDSGSSGSPLLNLSNNKVFGVHKGASTNKKYNKGIFLREPINDFFEKKKQ